MCGDDAKGYEIRTRSYQTTRKTCAVKYKIHIQKEIHKWMLMCDDKIRHDLVMIHTHTLSLHVLLCIKVYTYICRQKTAATTAKCQLKVKI